MRRQLLLLTLLLFQASIATSCPTLAASSRATATVIAAHVDIPSGLSLLVRATTERTKQASNMASHIARNSTLEEKVLAQCQTKFDDAVESLGSGMIAVAREDKLVARYMFWSAMRDYGSCRQELMKVPGIDRVMLEEDELLVKMASDCLALLELL